MSNHLNIENVPVDYTKSLYDWKNTESELQIVNNHLAEVDVLASNVLTYYGDGQTEGLRIAYISDIHLHHHLKYYNDDENRMITTIVKKLHSSLNHLNEDPFNKIYAVFLGGDISDTPEMTLKFLKQLRANVSIPIFFVLGNHEYIEFPNVQCCVAFYKDKLQELQITTSYCRLCFCSQQCLLAVIKRV